MGRRKTLTDYKKVQKVIAANYNFKNGYKWWVEGKKRGRKRKRWAAIEGDSKYLMRKMFRIPELRCNFPERIMQHSRFIDDETREVRRHLTTFSVLWEGKLGLRTWNRLQLVSSPTWAASLYQSRRPRCRAAYFPKNFQLNSVVQQAKAKTSRTMKKLNSLLLAIFLLIPNPSQRRESHWKLKFNEHK